MITEADSIEQHVRACTAMILAAAEAELATEGIKVGALVFRESRHSDRGHYIIDNISWGRMRSPLLWLEGRKLRKDGTFGTFRHGIGQPYSIRVASADFSVEAHANG